MSADGSHEGPSRAELEALREGLSRPLREIAARYFYDDRGSALFEQITQLEEYYPTRTEIAILREQGAAMITSAPYRHVFELGSGAGTKIRALLDRWPAGEGARVCTMLDVNERFLQDSIDALSAAYEGITFRGVLGDFNEALAPSALEPSPRLTVFFAGTIGNLYPDERARFFARQRTQMGPSDALLLGVDLVKDRARLEAAYNDRQGVTAEFNRNALAVLNARFGADFDPSRFEHVAFFDAERAWIEMRLRARAAMNVRVPGLDLRIALREGEEIRTEISCKFTRRSLDDSLSAAGLSRRAWFTDAREDFALALIGADPR